MSSVFAKKTICFNKANLYLFACHYQKQLN